MECNQSHTGGEEENTQKHSKPATAMIGNRTEQGSENSHERPCSDNEGQGCEVYAEAARKDRQERVHHPVHGIHDGAKEYEDEELKADTHKLPTLQAG
jgi:hypothetical protein